MNVSNLNKLKHPEQSFAPSAKHSRRVRLNKIAFLFSLFIIFALTACNVTPQVPPTAIVIIVTPTSPLAPSPVIIVITAAPTSTPLTSLTLIPLNPNTPTTQAPNNPPTQLPNTPTTQPPTNPPAPTATLVRATAVPQATTALIPTPSSNNLTAYWGPHENGFFVYLSDRKEIWAFMGLGNAPAVTPVRPLTPAPTSIPKGNWQKFPDTFKPGTDLDTDATIIAPPGMLQPKGGFGKVWRANANVRLALGWATDWERAYIANIVDFSTRSGNTLVTQHTLTTPDGSTYLIDEAKATWERR